MSLLRARELGQGVVLNGPDTTDPQSSPRPWVHPFTTPTGAVVTDDRPADHPWHRGLSLAVANLDAGDATPHNFWGGPTFVEGEYAQLDNNGHQRLVERRVDADASTESLHWCAADGRVLLTESRRLEQHRSNRSRVPVTRLDWTSTVVSTSSRPLGFGSPTTAGRPAAGYGGLFLRASPAFIGAEVLLDGVVVEPSRAMGRRAQWAALRTPRLTVVMAADGANPVSPSPWFVRTEAVAMLCAAPFFDEQWMLAPGAAATWRWTVLACDGSIDAASLADLLVGE